MTPEDRERYEKERPAVRRMMKEARWKLNKDRLLDARQEFARETDVGRRAALRKEIQDLETTLERLAIELEEFHDGTDSG